MANKPKIDVPPGHKVIFRPWRKCPKTGKILYASSYGLKVWPIIVPA